MKPKITIDEIKNKIGGDYAKLGDLFIVGFRGYYANTFGKKGVNDRRFYDDAFIVVEKEKIIGAFSANTDPSIFRQNVATLATGIYDVKKHRHKGQYEALQIVFDVVMRDGRGNLLFKGTHGINFHYDGNVIPTGSLGCQTLRKNDWFGEKGFKNIVYRAMARNNKSTIKYGLYNY